MILLVLSENAQHEIEEHVMVKEEEFPVDALHMDAEQQFVQAEGRLSSQARMKEQLAYHVHDPPGGTQEKSIRCCEHRSKDKRGLKTIYFPTLCYFLYERVEMGGQLISQSKQTRMEQLAYHVHDLTGGTQEKRV